MGDGLNMADLKKLSEEFPEDCISVKAQALSRDGSRVLLVPYIEHQRVQTRLSDVDPSWSCETVEQKELETDDARIVCVRMRLTVKGVTRENVGEGSSPKAAYSDALKRCAMLFGVARYLYDTERVWLPFDKERDRYRSWTLEDYTRGAQKHQGVQNEGKPRGGGKSGRRGAVLSLTKKPQPYRIKLGKLKGKKFDEVDPEILFSKVVAIKEMQEEGEKLSAQQLEFFEKASAYLATLDN